MRRASSALLCAAATLLAVPATAGAHSIVRTSSGVISYISSDAISLNKLSISLVGTDIRLADPTVDGGIDQGPCRPGATNDDGFVTEVFCGRTGTNQVRVELGEREDEMRVAESVPVPLLALGGGGRDTLVTAGRNDIVVGNEGDDLIDAGAGNDQINGSEGADTVRGSGGDDTIQAGPGADPEVSGGPGNDDIRVRDGAADKVTCGEGSDKVDADLADEVAADCETVARAAPPPGSDGSGTDGSGSGGTGDPGTGGSGPGPGPGGSGSGSGTGSGGGPGDPDAGTVEDRVAPKLRIGGSTSQRLRASGTVRVLATSSERGTVAASGFLDAAGVRLPLKSKIARVESAGGGAVITVKLSKGQVKRARRALRKRRSVSVRLGVVATDAAGNSTAGQAPVIRLRR